MGVIFWLGLGVRLCVCASVGGVVCASFFMHTNFSGSILGCCCSSCCHCHYLAIVIEKSTTGPNDCVHTQTRTIRIICILIAKFCVCIVSFSTIVCVASVFSIHQFVVYGCFKLRLLLPLSSLSLPLWSFSMKFVVLFRFCSFIAGNFISFFFGIFVIKTCLLSPSSFFAHTLSVPLLPTFSLATFLLSLHSVRIQ